DSKAPLQKVPYEHEGRCASAECAQHVSSTHFAAAVPAYINIPAVGYDNPDRHRPNEVSQDCYQDVGPHHLLFSGDLVDAKPCDNNIHPLARTLQWDCFKTRAKGKTT